MVDCWAMRRRAIRWVAGSSAGGGLEELRELRVVIGMMIRVSASLANCTLYAGRNPPSPIFIRHAMPGFHHLVERQAAHLDLIPLRKLNPRRAPLGVRRFAHAQQNSASRRKYEADS